MNCKYQYTSLLYCQEQSFSVQHLLDKVGGQHHDAWRNNRCGTFLAISWPNFPALRVHLNELNRAMDTKFNSNIASMMNENHCHTGAKIETFRHASWDRSSVEVVSAKTKTWRSEEGPQRKPTHAGPPLTRGIKYPSSSDFAKRESKRIYSYTNLECLTSTDPHILFLEASPRPSQWLPPLRLPLAWQRMAVHVAALWWCQGHPQTIRPLWVPP